MVNFVVLVVLPLIVAASLVMLPGFWVNLLLFVDFYTPWVLFESPLYDKYHDFLVGRLPERPELPLQEITPAEASYENLLKLSKGFTEPIVIRGLLGNASSLDTWHKPEWWLEHYAQEEVLCGTLSNVVEDCTVSSFFKELKEGKPFYISGASHIFDRNPELHDMVDNEQIRSIEPGRRKSTQMFMGTPKMGSDIHSALGVNVFRQIAGEKKWWFLPPSQTAYLKPSINVNGFSSHTKTLVGRDDGEPSPWLSKLERYTTVVRPGDVLINPPWYWHGILNLGEAATDIIIGCPSRYGAGETMKAGVRSHFLFTVNALFTLYQRYGFKALNPDFKINLQGDIADNRRQREGKELRQEFHPFELAD